MKYLNLTKGFNPYNADESELIKFESFFFNGGEPHIKLNVNTITEDYIMVTSRLTSMNDFMMLMIATEALTQSGINYKGRFLFIPYMPGARQDRRMVNGEPLSVRVFTSLINDMNYDNVKTFDNHSDVATALLDNSENLNNHKFVQYCLDNINSGSYSIVSPDAGSNKKINKLLSCGLFYFSPNVLIKCDKNRNTQTGEIIGIEVYKDYITGDCIIIDDICDGGRTFIETAKALKAKGADKIYLIVSHGIFSQPLKTFKGLIDRIYTTDSWRSEFNWEQQERDNTDLVKIVEFNKFL